MGGEPTFVSVDDMESPEWNDRRGRPRQARAGRRSWPPGCASRWAPAGLLQHGQGKWYPGEPLPRWRMDVVWRPDGEPLWRDPSLLGTPWRPGPLEPGSTEAARAAADLAAAIAARLGVPADCVLPAYEDALHQLCWEASRPAGEPPRIDVDPEDPAFGDAERRDELVRALDAAPGVPRGWVLPLFRTEDGEHWGSARWQPRRRHLFLTPGTSPPGCGCRWTGWPGPRRRPRSSGPRSSRAARCRPRG